MLSLAVSDGGHERWIEHAVRLYPGHFEVSLAGYREYRTLDYAMPLDGPTQRDLDAAVAKEWTPRLEAFGLISADTEQASGRAVQLFGLDGGREAHLSKLIGSIDAGRMATGGHG